MISWMLFGGLASIPIAATGCSAPIQPIFDVVLAVQPVSIGSTIHLSDLATLAAQKNVPLRHPAYVITSVALATLFASWLRIAVTCSVQKV